MDLFKDKEIITRSKGRKMTTMASDMSRTRQDTSEDMPGSYLPSSNVQRPRETDEILTSAPGACSNLEGVSSDSEKNDVEEIQPEYHRRQMEAGDNAQGVNTQENTLRKLLLEMKSEVSAEISGAIKEALSTNTKTMRDNSVNRPVEMDSRIRGDNSNAYTGREARPRTRANIRYRESDSDERQPRPHRDRRYGNRLGSHPRSFSEDTDEGEFATSNTENSCGRRENPADKTASKLPPYTGKEKWKVWINRFTEVARLKRWDDNRKLVEMLPRLQGPAGEFVYGQLSHRTRTDFKALVKELNSRFRVVETSKTFGAQFSDRNQRAGEPVEEYAAELKMLYDKAHSYRDHRTRQEDLLRRFLDGLSDNKTRFHVEYIKEPADIDEAVYEVVNFQETRRIPDATDNGMEKRNRRPARLVRPYSDSEEEDGIGEEESEAKRVARAPPRPKKSQAIKNVPWKDKEPQETSNQEKGDNSPATTHSEKNEDANNSEDIKQLTTALKQLNDRMMKLEGNDASQPHITPENRNNQSKAPHPNRITGAQNRMGRKCFNCQEEGHFARECTKPRWGFTFHQDNGVRGQPRQFHGNNQNYSQQTRPYQGN